MGWFDIFKRGEPPVAVHEDPRLGRLEWVSDAEGWHGQYNGYTILIGYDRQSSPGDLLLAKAAETLAVPADFQAAFERAKSQAVEDYPEFREEIASLRIGEVFFYQRRQNWHMLIDLPGGRDGRCWRIEFTNGLCDGIGFDD